MSTFGRSGRASQVFVICMLVGGGDGGQTAQRSGPVGSGPSGNDNARFDSANAGDSCAHHGVKDCFRLTRNSEMLSESSMREDKRKNVSRKRRARSSY